MPSGGRPLVTANSIPAERMFATAVRARSVNNLSWVHQRAVHVGDKQADHFVRIHFCLPICFLAAATMDSGVKPNLRCNSFSGAEAPNVFMPMTQSELPT